MTAHVFGLAPATWDAIGSAATGGGFLLAGVAAVVAVVQLRLAKQTRLDQNRPYVLVTFEQGQTWGNSVDIVIRNVGTGPARDVRIVADPPLERTNEEPNMILAGVRFFNEPIPLMPPGYELRTYFDDLISRTESTLPARYAFTTSYHDGHGNSWSEIADQDIEIMNDLLFDEVLSIHHVAKTLQELTKAVTRMPLTKTPFEVTTETRSEYIARIQSEGEARRARFAAQREGAEDAANSPSET